MDNGISLVERLVGRIRFEMAVERVNEEDHAAVVNFLDTYYPPVIRWKPIETKVSLVFKAIPAEEALYTSGKPGGRIEAIKAFRQRTQLSPKECRDAFRHLDME